MKITKEIGLFIFMINHENLSVEVFKSLIMQGVSTSIINAYLSFSEYDLDMDYNILHYILLAEKYNQLEIAKFLKEKYLYENN